MACPGQNCPEWLWCENGIMVGVFRSRGQIQIGSGFVRLIYWVGIGRKSGIDKQLMLDEVNLRYKVPRAGITIWMLMGANCKGRQIRNVI